jgi:hypothetical protein
VIARLGLPPEPNDPWFDRIAGVADGAVDRFMPQGRIVVLLGEASPSTECKEPGPIRFWRDDWEVFELEFIDIHDLSQNGLVAMRASRSEVGAR